MSFILPNEKSIKTLGSHLGFFALYLFLIFSCSSISAQGYFEFSPIAKQAYNNALNLKLDDARLDLALLEEQEPNNAISALIENYIDFFTVFINEEKEQFRRLERNKSKRLERIKSADTFSPYYNFCQAEIYLQWALARLKFEEYFTAFSEIKNAYRLLKNNSEEFPNFIANKKSLGVMHALIGTIPDAYQWSVKLLGRMEGSIEQGQNEIEEVLEFARKHDFIFERETVFMYSLLMLHLKNNSETAWTSISSTKFNYTESPLACFALANVAMRTGRNDQAIKYIESSPTGDGYANFPYLNYMLGLAKLYRLDEDAEVFLQKYIDEFKGVNYIKEAHQKIAWSKLIKGDIIAYRERMQLIQEQGEAVIGGDKMALREAKGGKAPNATLIKARLLFDGGYYEEAQKVLSEKNDEFINGENRLEYLYRLGRVYQKSGAEQQAIEKYEATIDEGRENPAYYACNAALQLGNIYESMGNSEAAIQWFETCLDIKPKEYRSGLHQKAKAGLNRME